MHWTYTKRRLAFCQLTQDGEDEGCLHLDRLPATAEAEAIRRVIRLRQTMSDSQVDLLRLRMAGKPISRRTDFRPA